MYVTASYEPDDTRDARMDEPGVSNICACVCMYVYSIYIYICIYICMYVMYVCMCVRMYVCVQETDDAADARMDEPGISNICVCVCMYVYMYIFMYIYNVCMYVRM